MARKHNDAPIKLIHILPSSEKSPSSDSVDSAHTPFRLGIEGSNHSASNFFRFLQSLLPKSWNSSEGSPDDLSRSEETECSSAPHPSFRDRDRSCFEHLTGLWMGLCAKIIKPRMKNEEELLSSPPPSPYTLQEGEAENLELPEFQHETSNRPGDQREPLSLEVGALRDQVRSQQEDLARVTSQLTDLKNLMLSQQQVLLHLGKEMEGIHLAAGVPPPKAPRKSKPRVAKSSKTKITLTKKRPNDQPSSLEASP